MISTRRKMAPPCQSLFFFVCLVGLTALWAAPQALAKGGRLDKAFGDQGRAVKAVDFGESGYWYNAHVRVARAPDGRILVAGNGLVLEYLPSGRLNRSFAKDGVLRLESFEGAPFELRDVAVDSQGRIVVAGTVSIARRFAVLNRAVIFRFEPDGAPDSTFGGGNGLVATDFGLPPPKFAGDTEADVSVTGVATDSEDRVVVSGETLEYRGYCLRATAGYVARLTTDGVLDPSFGNGGTVTYSSTTLRSAEDLVLDLTGAPLFFGNGYSCRYENSNGPTMYRLNPDGSPDEAFGETGQIPAATPLTTAKLLQVAFDQTGRILMLTAENRVVRALPSGALDPSFGNDGVAHVRGSWNPGGLAVTQSGSVLIAGTGHHNHRGPEHEPRRWLTLVRLGPRGRLDRHFGNLGIVKARLGRGSSASGRQVLMVGERHAIVAGPVQSQALSTGEGLALFRFDLTR